jgi:Invasin, domain 3
VSHNLENSLLCRTLLRRVGFALLCAGGVTCGGDVGPPPQGAINISPNAISFAAIPGATVEAKTVGVTPATDAALTGVSATVAFASPPPNPWLSVEVGSQDATLESPAILTLEVTNTDLPSGTYRATVTVESANADNNPRVNVTLTVEAATALTLTTQPSDEAGSGDPLGRAPVVQLVTEAGDPVGQSGVEVGVALEGDGTLSGPATSSTDSEGRATFEGLVVTAPTGNRSLVFTAPGLIEVRSNPILITAGGAALIAAGSVTTQPAEVGTPVFDPPIVLVTDNAGNPIAGVPVTFAVTTGGGTIDPTTPVATDADGLARATSWTLGPNAGANAATASADGLEGSPVTFAATGTIGGVVPGPISEATSSVVASPASFAAGPTGTTITVTARDAANTPIGGATIVLSSTGSDFEFGSTTLTTGTTGATLGRATTTYTSTRAEAKSISADITAAGVTVTPAAAAVTVAAGEPDGSLSTLLPNPGTVLGLVDNAAGGAPRTSVVQVTLVDAFGNPVGGRAVTMTVIGGPGGDVLTQPAGPTGTGGRTGARLSSTTGGTYVVQAVVDGGPTISQTAQVTFLLTFTDDIEPIFLSPFDGGNGFMTTPCASCHLPYKTVGGSSPSLSFTNMPNLAVPGNPNGSLLVQALEHSSPLPAKWMPSSGQTLPAAVIGRIRQWIAQEGTLRQ